MADRVKLNPQLRQIDTIEIDGVVYTHDDVYDGPTDWKDHTTQSGGFLYPTFVVEGSAGRGPVEGHAVNKDTGMAVTQNVGHGVTGEQTGGDKS